MPLRTVQRLHRLVREGMSYRRIARQLGCHRNTVWRHVNGIDAPKGEDKRANGRCPGCGMEVDLPCRVCEARAIAERRRPATVLATRDARPAPRGRDGRTW